MAASKEHPVVAGLAALVGVGLAVGLLLGLVAMVGASMAGVTGDAVTGEATGQESLYVPKPSKTEGPPGPLITLAPGPSPEQQNATAEQSPKNKKAKKKRQISLQAGQDSVGSMERIDLTGTYQRGEGSILQVQRLQNGTWEDFPVTAPVANQNFATYVQTGQTGKNTFRMRDSDTTTTSNPVTVTVK